MTNQVRENEACIGMEMNDGPLVSVVMPTYNCAAYIVEAIESVLSQTYRRFEVIVVDDGSRDHTRAVLEPYLDRIHYLYQENRGLSAARNLGIRCAQGELIAFLDSDDYWYPDKLVRQVQAFQEYPEAGLSFTNHLEFGESGIIYRSGFSDKVYRWLGDNTNASMDVVCGWIYRELLQSNYMHVCSVIVRRDVLKQVGHFDETIRICEDYDLWLKVTQRYPVLCVNNVLCGYRYRPEGLSGSTEAREIRWNGGWIAILEEHLRANEIPGELQGVVNEVLSQRYWRVGWLHFSRNRFREARSQFLRGIWYRPFLRRHWIYLSACLLPLPIVEALREIKRSHIAKQMA